MLRRFSDKYGETVLLLTLIPISFYLISVGLEIPTGRSRASITPATWPILSLGMIVSSAVLLLIFKVLNRKRDKLIAKDSAEEIIGDPKEEEETYPERAFYTASFMIIYLLVLPYVGFIPVSLVAMGCYMISIGATRKFSIITPFVMTAIIIIVFGIALKVPLPRGVGVFKEFSMLFH